MTEPSISVQINNDGYRTEEAMAFESSAVAAAMLLDVNMEIRTSQRNTVAANFDPWWLCVRIFAAVVVALDVTVVDMAQTTGILLSW